MWDSLSEDDRFLPFSQNQLGWKRSPGSSSPTSSLSLHQMIRSCLFLRVARGQIPPKPVAAFVLFCRSTSLPFEQGREKKKKPLSWITQVKLYRCCLQLLSFTFWLKSTVVQLAVKILSTPGACKPGGELGRRHCACNSTQQQMSSHGLWLLCLECSKQMVREPFSSQPPLDFTDKQQKHFLQ